MRHLGCIHDVHVSVVCIYLYMIVCTSIYKQEGSEACFRVIFFRNQYILLSHQCTTFDASRSPCSLCALVLPRQTPFRFHYMSDAIALKVNHRHCVIVTRITRQNVGVRFASDSSKRGPRLLWYMGSSHLVSAISCDRVQPTQAAGLDSAEPGGLGSLYGQFEDRMITLYRCGQNHNPIIQCTVSVLNTRSGTNGAGESKVTVTSCVASRYFQYKPISPLNFSVFRFQSESEPGGFEVSPPLDSTFSLATLLYPV